MNVAIYNPLEEYKSKFQSLHLDNTEKFFEKLAKQSGVNIEENRATVAEYELFKDNSAKLKRKLNWFSFFRVLMIISLVLIPLVILKMTPSIKKLRSELENSDKKVEELFALANSQMLPLNSLFTAQDALGIIEATIPLISFDSCFFADQEADMKNNFDFGELSSSEQSTLDTLAGRYNGNPFLFENRLVHTMGTETYHGYKTITWVERYRGSDGKMHSVRRSQTLHASVTKPKPFYSTQVVLNYGSQGGPDLSFSRDATHLDNMSEKALDRYIKRGEKRLKKLTDKAIKKNQNFTGMSNSDFEVLFDALNRNNEVQYRTLFTPLAQTNMVSLIVSKIGYGDDFNFFKHKRMNMIVSNHSQGRPLLLEPREYISHSFDIIKENFISKNTEYFKAVYFDFAPLLAIPVYQERPVHSLKPISNLAQRYSQKEYEVLANIVDKEYLVHPKTKTNAIFKSEFVKSLGNTDEACITAYSYDIIQRQDVVPVFGGDGKLHNVYVSWDEYIPLKNSNSFYVAAIGENNGTRVFASKNGLCLMQ